MLNKAQSTIEYLILIVVIVVAGLLVVYFATSFFDSGSTIDSGDKIGSKISLGSISIFEVVGDNDNVVMILNSVMEDGVTLTKINVDGVENIFDRKLFSSKKGFVLENLSQNCACSNEQLFRNCSFDIYYITKEGLSKKESLTIKVECIDNIDIDRNDYYRLKEDEDSEAPIIELLSPSNNDLKQEREIEFEFTASDNIALTSCSLIINGVVEETITSDFTSFTKEFSGEEAWDDYEWDINCTDSSDNVASSTNGVFNLSVQTFGGGDGSSGSPFEIYNCHQLQDMNSHLSSNYFVLAQDIDCSDTINWNGGLGFEPIGYSPGLTPDNPFLGDINGQGFLISNLYINRPEENFVGLFGYTYLADIISLEIVGGEIVGAQAVGGLVGLAKTSLIHESGFSGEVSGTDIVGGLIGWVNTQTNVIESYSFGTASSISSGSKIAGLVGYMQGSSRIYDSYSWSKATGNENVGGLVGRYESSNIYRTYAAGLVTGSSLTGGLVGSANSSSSTNSFWDTQTTNQATSPGIGGGTSGETGKTTAQMYQEATFTNWDFTDEWDIDEDNNYPTLKWQQLVTTPSEPSLPQALFANGPEGSSGTSIDSSHSLFVDSSGNIYVSGYFTSSTLDFGNGITLSNPAGGSNFKFFLVKYNSLGVAQWAKTATNDSGVVVLDNLWDIYVDESGNVYGVGSTYSANPNFGDGITFSNDGIYDFFLIKYNSSGTAQWVKTSENNSGTGIDRAFKIKLDSSNNIYMAGISDSNLDFGNGVTISNGYGTAEGFFIAKYNSSGVAQWAVGTSESNEFDFDDVIEGLDFDSSENIYVFGDSWSSKDFGNGITTTNDGGPDFFITKFNPSGVAQLVLTSENSSGTGGEMSRSLSIDSSDNIYIIVSTQTENLDFGNGITESGSTFYDEILVKYNSLGVAQWAKKVDSNYNVYASTDGNVYLSSSGTNAFLKYDSTGELQYIKSLDSGSTISGWEASIFVDESENIYISGSSQSDLDFGDSITLTNKGNTDFFVVKYAPQ